MKHFIYSIAIVFWILGSIFFVQAETDTFVNFYARVKREDINVRARANTSSEVMYRLKKNEDVLVIAETEGWFKIKPKEDFFAWVRGDMLNNGIVAKDKINVRAGPTTNSSILGSLKEGTPVLISAKQDAWMKIEMPRGFGYWVASNLVQFLCPQEKYQDFLLQAKHASKDFEAAEEARKQELTKRYTDVDHDKLLSLYQAILDQYPGSIEAAKAMERIIDTKEKKAMAQIRTLTVEEHRRILTQFDEAELLQKKVMIQFTPEIYDEALQKFKKIVSQYPSTEEAKLSLSRIDALEKVQAEKMEEWKQKTQFADEGKLRGLSKSSAFTEATHALTQGVFKRHPVCFLFSKNIDLKAYENKKVRVTGQKVSLGMKKDSPPLVEVMEIRLKTDS
jgi:SH3-like domain-containing protein